jgi:PIN domain nuclease of toxin-antitoxin system
VNEREIIADASAILAALKNERFSLFEPDHLVRASICSVNFSEVLTKLRSDGLTAEQSASAAGRLDLRVVAFDRDLASIAADLWVRTRRFGLALGDRACLALGLQLNHPVVTADRVWAGLDIGVDVILIR